MFLAFSQINYESPLKKADSQLLIDLVKHPNMWNTETLSEAVVKHDVVFTTTHRSVSENGVRELLG
jgi:hypothetical protein